MIEADASVVLSLSVTNALVSTIETAPASSVKVEAKPVPELVPFRSTTGATLPPLDAVTSTVKVSASASGGVPWSTAMTIISKVPI